MTTIADNAAQLLAAYGADAVLHTEAPTFDPATSTTVHQGAASQTVKVVEEDSVTRIGADADAVVYLAPAGLKAPPALRGRVEYQGRTWTIVSVRPWLYQGAIVLYAVGLKGAAQ